MTSPDPPEVADPPPTAAHSSSMSGMKTKKAILIPKQSKHLPSSIELYVVNQIQRARILQQLHEIDDDLSSVGSCNIMCTQFFVPRRCAVGDSDDDLSVESGSDDSIVDTV